MTLLGETEAGSAGMQPCRGITEWALRTDALKIPAPQGAEPSLTENVASPFQAEPTQ
jgi:hypothetical protein